MIEQVAWAELPSVAAAIRAVAWSTTAAYMYLEQVPRTFLDASARQHGLQLQYYAADTSFDTWQCGRVFDAQHELKWEQRRCHFHVVYCGKQMPTTFTPFPLDMAFSKAGSYYLWGQRVPDPERTLLGIAPETPAFAQLQIPRILLYPVSPEQERVQVQVYEFYSPSGQLCYARWYGLQ